jgi:hypothetical protein
MLCQAYPSHISSPFFRLQGFLNPANLSIEKKVAADWQLKPED